jgi:hypothetical protein
VSSKAKHKEPTATRQANGKNRSVPPSSRNGESSKPAAMGIAIEKDFHGWLVAQAQAIRERRLEALDWENIAEELDGMARSEKHALTGFLRVMLTHLLKWSYQTTKREPHLSSWRTSIVNSRQEIEDVLEDSPSLGRESNLNSCLQKAYRQARTLAAAEMGISDRERDRLFSAECPWTFVQFMADGFLPEERSTR